MREHRGIWLPDGDTHLASHLDRGPLFEGKGTYQLAKITPVLNFFSTTGNPDPGLALDVGAHVGLWSRVLASKFARIIAFEPMEHLRECFAKNLADAGACEVQLIAAAVGAETKTVHMVRVPDNSGNCHVAPDFRPEFTVDQIRLDEMIEDDEPVSRVDFIKIDTEGYEEFVIRGALKLIDRDKPLIMIEQKPGVAQERYGLGQHRAKEILEKLGYTEIFYRSGDHLMCHPENHRK